MLSAWLTDSLVAGGRPCDHFPFRIELAALVRPWVLSSIQATKLTPGTFCCPHTPHSSNSTARFCYIQDPLRPGHNQSYLRSTCGPIHLEDHLIFVQLLCELLPRLVVLRHICQHHSVQNHTLPSIVCRRDTLPLALLVCRSGVIADKSEIN